MIVHSNRNLLVLTGVALAAGVAWLVFRGDPPAVVEPLASAKTPSSSSTVRAADPLLRPDGVAPELATDRTAVAPPAVVPPVPLTEDERWARQYADLGKLELKARAEELEADFQGRLKTVADQLLANGRYVDVPLPMAEDATPTPPPGYIASSNSLIENGPNGNVMRRVQITEADDPELGALKREIAWLRIAARSKS